MREEEVIKIIVSKFSNISKQSKYIYKLKR